jgi:phosphomannomutase
MQALSDSGKTLAELVDDYRRYDMMPERNIEYTGDKAALLDRLAEVFKEGRQDRLDGLTVWYDHAWFNLRASNTEPVLRLNAEAESRQELDDLVGRVMAVVEA